MPSNFLWAGAGVYSAGPTTWLSTELNTLANSAANVLSTLGAAFQNTAGLIYADVDFVPGGSITPTAGAFLELWLLKSVDGGTNYEAGSATLAPARPADCTIPLIAAAGTNRAGYPGLRLPPAFYKPILRNQSGVALSATLNVLRFSAYTETQ
jgi:hypothetical protein